MTINQSEDNFFQSQVQKSWGLSLCSEIEDSSSPATAKCHICQNLMNCDLLAICNELKHGFLRIWTGNLNSYNLAQHIETRDFHISPATFLNAYVITTYNTVKDSKIWNLANYIKKWNKEHHTLSFPFFINKSSALMLFVLFFHVVC